ncbi:mucin-2-like [Ostrinia furnacalis]|uniref:mucin-2-like n=1 Tax=Ostrinia furnacalis TaxID=93504 RepID=UPI00103C4E83|nr:mucin-2-like [Ostrinia furnacalis]
MPETIRQTPSPGETARRMPSPGPTPSTGAIRRTTTPGGISSETPSGVQRRISRSRRRTQATVVNFGEEYPHLRNLAPRTTTAMTTVTTHNRGVSTMAPARSTNTSTSIEAFASMLPSTTTSTTRRPVPRIPPPPRTNSGIKSNRHPPPNTEERGSNVQQVSGVIYSHTGTLVEQTTGFHQRSSVAPMSNPEPLFDVPMLQSPEASALHRRRRGAVDYGTFEVNDNGPTSSRGDGFLSMFRGRDRREERTLTDEDITPSETSFATLPSTTAPTSSATAPTASAAAQMMTTENDTHDHSTGYLRNRHRCQSCYMRYVQETGRVAGPNSPNPLFAHSSESDPTNRDATNVTVVNIIGAYDRHLRLIASRNLCNFQTDAMPRTTNRQGMYPSVHRSE